MPMALLRLSPARPSPAQDKFPIKFKVEYNREDISSRSRYSIRAKIVESDGRLAFTNDTVYEAITHGNPDKVNMLLVLVRPPPDLVGGSNAGEDWQTWVEVPVPVVWANLIPNEPEHLLRVAYLPVHNRRLCPSR